MSADTLALLVQAGLSGDALVAVVRSMEADGAPPSPPRSAGAERQRRWRERHAEAVTSGVSGDVTRDASPRDANPLPLPPSPQTPQPPTPSPERDTPRGREATADQLSKVAVLRQAFEGFWAEYPRKVAKPTAERAYAKALGKPGVSPGVILVGLRRHLGGWATGDPEFVPHPATWLNREGWNDEADAPRQPRLIHDGTIPHHDRRSAAFRERLQDVGHAADAAVGQWHAERGG